MNDIGALNSGTTDKGDRYTVSYVDQFLDGTLGVALGYALLAYDSLARGLGKLEVNPQALADDLRA